jgi:hypothetical protein
MVGYEELPLETQDEQFTFVAISDGDSKCDYRVDYSALPFDNQEFDKVMISPTVTLSTLSVEELKRVQK